MNTISRYASLVKFSHTLFGLPFALISYVYSLTAYGIPFDAWLLLKILLCMLFARNAAMGFNRWADRRIDAANPRTAGREIPAGKISPGAAIWFVIINAAAFVATTWFINMPAFRLSPLALFILLGYSYTKRFTAWSHIVLGAALSIAPIGAFVAVTGLFFDFVPLLLAALVMTWVSGFDILYSMQDRAFDRANNLRSVAARFSPRASAAISIALHILSAYCVTVLGMIYGFGALYWIGAALFISMLVVQHILYSPGRIDRIGATFGLVNGFSSVAYAIFVIADLLTK